jgi:hypothetical protein
MPSGFGGVLNLDCSRGDGFYCEGPDDVFDFGWEAGVVEIGERLSCGSG